MKTLFTYLLACTAPLAVLAQPTEMHGEFYYVGDIVQMANCDATGVSAGASGNAGTWDFTGLVQSGALITTTYANDTAAAYPTSSVLATLSNGSKMHIQENNTDSYLLGTENTISGEIAQYSNYNSSKRPMTYNTSYIDTFYKTIPATGAFGRGYLTVTGDAYGTLKLPTGTYDNVLRVRKYLVEGDSLGTTQILSSTTVTYVWFDTVHRAPLLRMDSVSSTGGSGNTIMYLANPTAISKIATGANSYSAYLNNSSLVVTGDFNNATSYQVAMYSIIGSEIFKQDFATTANSYKFDVMAQLSPGIYIVTIAPGNDLSVKSVIKVMKQ